MFFILAKELLDVLSLKNFCLQIQLHTVLPLLSEKQAEAGAGKGNANDEESGKCTFTGDVERKHENDTSEKNRKEPVDNELVKERPNGGGGFFYFFLIPSCRNYDRIYAEAGPNNFIPGACL